MQEFIDFILIDLCHCFYLKYARHNGFCVVLGTIIMVMQSSLNAGNFR